MIVEAFNGHGAAVQIHRHAQKPILCSSSVATIFDKPLKVSARRQSLTFRSFARSHICMVELLKGESGSMCMTAAI